MKIIDLHYQLGQSLLFQGLHADFRDGIIGISGENGCGKSTLLRILAGLCQPSRGAVEIRGHNLYSEPALCKKMLGFVPARSYLYPYFTVEENLYFVSMIFQLSKKEYKQQLTKILNEFQLEDYKQVLFGKCSDGIKKRIMIACAFIHDASIIILDEPCASLSSISRQWLWTLLQTYAKRGKQIIFSSHHVDEVSQLCTQRYVLEQGQLHLQHNANNFSEIVLTQTLDDLQSHQLEVNMP